MSQKGKMKLLELVILKGDVNIAMEYLGKSGNFQMYKEEKTDAPFSNTYKDSFDRLHVVATYLGLKIDYLPLDDASFPSSDDEKEISKIISEVEHMQEEIEARNSSLENAEAAYNEAIAFSRLHLPYNEVDALTFLTIRMGKIHPSLLDSLKFAVGSRAIIIPINEDGSKIVAASSKKGRLALDSELKKVDFIPIEIPKNFKGMPGDVLDALTASIKEKRKEIEELKNKVQEYGDKHGEHILDLLKKLSIAYQVFYAKCNLDEAQEVYRLRGWTSSADVPIIAKDLLYRSMMPTKFLMCEMGLLKFL